jgi:CRISPR-associated endoribonuclease Cas6
MEQYQLKFECIKDGTVFGLGGSECHGLIYALLGKILPEYSQSLHEARFNPYSLGPLRGEGRSINGIYHLASGGEYSFTISSFTDEMRDAISSLRTLMHPAYHFRLGSADCRWLTLEKIAEAKYQELLRESTGRQFDIVFLSPTCFRRQGISLLFPSPELVFTNLLERWNAFAPISMDVEPSEMLFVSRYNLKTSLVRFAKYKMTGFTGKVEYSFSNSAAEDRRQLIGALARFANFAGIGYKTGMGMGECRFSKK